MAFEHYDKCSLLLPMDGANNGTIFTDWSPNPKTVTVAGNAKTVTAQSKHYGSSGYFDGSGDYLTVPNSPELLFSGDFTVSFWIYFDTTLTENYPRIIIKGADNAAGGLSIVYGRTEQAIVSRLILGSNSFSTNLWSSTGSVLTGQWYHYAFTRSGSTVYAALNGTVYGSNTDSNAVSNTGLLYIGVSQGSVAYLKGYLQDLLIIKGAALWTSNFTPPTRLIGTISGTTHDKDNTPASRIVTAFPRTVPTKLYQTTSSEVDGSFSLRLPATESTALVMANEGVMRNDIVDRIIPE